MTPGKTTDEPGKVLHGPMMDSLAAVAGSPKLNSSTLVKPRLVRFARTASVNCCVSPGKRSAVALEEAGSMTA